jgi:hypothetical protein
VNTHGISGHVDATPLVTALNLTGTRGAYQRLFLYQ